MKATQILKMLREIKDVSLATVDKNGNPKNRIIDCMLVDENAYYFLTARGKTLYEELENNPNVAIVGLNKDWQMLRLTGKAERLEDQKTWIDKMFEENPSMNNVYPNDSRYILEPFVIRSGALEFFDLSSEPITRESFPLGDGTVTEKGYVITENCIGCGLCKRNCPQQCVKEGTPYEIEQEHCLHCGLCYENCPVQAIEKRGEAD